ncbi:MAG: nitroreductase family protein, partial [Promethearchaeota archaeon]
MEALEAIMTRVSIRDFANEPISDEHVEILLKAMIAAPSGGNLQPWRIYVV